MRAGKHGLVIDGVLVDRLRNSDIGRPSFAEQLQAVLRWISSQTKDGTTRVEVINEDTYPIAWCKSAEEFGRVLEALSEPPGLIAREGNELWIREEGWSWLRTLAEADRTRGIVVMPFDPQMTMRPVQIAIERVVKVAGYLPEIARGSWRRSDHDLRSCRFAIVVLDRPTPPYRWEDAVIPGVDVIWLREISSDNESDWGPSNESDVRTIYWERTDLAAMSERLTAAIAALAGRGPLRG